MFSLQLFVLVLFVGGAAASLNPDLLKGKMMDFLIPTRV